MVVNVLTAIGPAVKRWQPVGVRTVVGMSNSRTWVAVYAADQTGVCVTATPDRWELNVVRRNPIRRVPGYDPVVALVACEDYQAPDHVLQQALVSGFLAWADPGNREHKLRLFLDHLTVAGLWSSTPGDADPTVSELTALHDHRHDGGTCPGPDGRYTIAGVTEPYPLAWPGLDLYRALGGDLSALWPNLGS